VFVKIDTNAGQLQAVWIHRIKELPLVIREQMKAYANEVKKEARMLSGVRKASLYQLRKLRHPYAAKKFSQRLKSKDVHMPAPAYVINKQSGLFWRSWAVRERTVSGVRTVLIVNNAWYSKYMNRTQLMIRRPILDEAIRRTARKHGNSTKHIHDGMIRVYRKRKVR
jgi:hypothetical protein